MGERKHAKDVASSVNYDINKGIADSQESVYAKDTK